MTNGVPAEEWRAIEGFEGLYEVSDLGRVRGLDRIEQCGPRTRRRAGVVLRQGLDDQRRPVVQLSRGGRSRPYRVHKLVARAFLGPCPRGALVRHLDDVRAHNAATNLAYGTKADNWADAARNGVSGLRTRRSRCGRGHDLVAPNLTRSTTGGGLPICLSCSRARAAVRGGYGLGSDGAPVEVVADRYFRQITITEGAA